MANAPDTLTLTQHRDQRGEDWKLWTRRGLIALLCVIPLLGLLNVFGQRPSTKTETGDTAKLAVYAPTRVRGGLLYQARFHVEALKDLKKAQLVLDSGWAESMTINTIEPSPVDEGSQNGRILFNLGHIPQGESFVLYMEFQVNPTNVGRRAQDVELYDGQTRLLKVDRDVTIFP